MKNIHIPNEQELKKKLAKIKSDGFNKLHVISDWDSTLTKEYVDGVRVGSSFAKIRNGKYISEDYVEKAHAFHKEYYPIEIDPNISMSVKCEKMLEWWKKHLDLLVSSGMNKDVIIDIIKNKKTHPRQGFFEFLDILNKHDVPLLIFSAGLGDFIKEFLISENKLTNNIHIISNLFKFDNEGKVLGYENTIIHTFNKNEVQIENFPYHDKIHERSNVILLGDSIGDLGMVAGVKHDCVIKIGLLNDNVDELLDSYEKIFDMIILNDVSLDSVNDLLNNMI